MSSALPGLLPWHLFWDQKHHLLLSLFMAYPKQKLKRNKDTGNSGRQENNEKEGN